MHHYSAYNLGIRSDIALPELAPAPYGSDLVIRVTEPLELSGARSVDFEDASGGAAVFCLPGVGRFVVRGGCEVSITPDPNADRSIFGLYVQGMMLAAAMYQRGYFVLHASVVRIEGHAIAISGTTGAGKSTLASALKSRGHRILADDNAAIDLFGPETLVLPSFPNLKIYPQIARSLGYRDSSLRFMHSSQIKHSQSIADGFWETPLPLRCIYLLDREASCPVSSPLSFVSTMTELIRHSVPTRWSIPGNGRHLKLCAQLASKVPLVLVRSFTTLDEIPLIAQTIEDHAFQGAGPILCAAL